jgi:hypothetical protein
MPIPREYDDICNMLIPATSQGRVNWFERGGSFVVRFPGFDFEIWSGTDERGDTRFIAIGLKDPNGRAVYDDWFMSEGTLEFTKLDELYVAARRHANRVPQKLEQMLQLLRQGGPIGSEPIPKP